MDDLCLSNQRWEKPEKVLPHKIFKFKEILFIAPRGFEPLSPP